MATTNLAAVHHSTMESTLPSNTIDWSGNMNGVADLNYFKIGFNVSSRGILHQDNTGPCKQAEALLDLASSILLGLLQCWANTTQAMDSSSRSIGNTKECTHNHRHHRIACPYYSECIPVGKPFSGRARRITCQLPNDKHPQKEYN